MEIEGSEDIFQAAEDTPATSLNLHVMAVVDSQLFRKFLSRNQDDVRQTHNAIVLYFSMIFAMVRSELLKKPNIEHIYQVVYLLSQYWHLLKIQPYFFYCTVVHMDCTISIFIPWVIYILLGCYSYKFTRLKIQEVSNVYTKFTTHIFYAHKI